VAGALVVADIDDAELRSFRARLQLFAWIMFGQSVVFDVLSAVQAIASGSTTLGEVLATRRELGANLILLVLALIIRYGRLTARWLSLLDPTVLWLTTAPTVLMGLQQPAREHPGLMGSIATMPLVMVRAALIPSTPLRTFLITFVAAAPGFIVGGIVPLLHSPTAAWLGSVLDIGIWWIVQVAVATLTSKITYGLRQRVREAEELGQYRLEEKIGQGGMGVVYRARHVLLRRPTAVKLLAPDQIGADSLERFAREVRVTAGLSHPNIVTVYDYGRTPEGIFYYAMELLDGIDLSQLVSTSGPLPPSRVRHVLLQAGEALAAAHAIGLIHRDVKPGNMMLCRGSGRHESVKLLDFGLVQDIGGAIAPASQPAAAAAGAAARPEESGEDRADPGRTRTGVRSLIGTPLFMAPESIARPAEVDARSDLYSLAAVGYFLLTGTPVFSGMTIGQICEHHLRSEPLPPSLKLGTAVPAAFERLIMRCLAKRPERRVGSALELVGELAELSDVNPWTALEAQQWWDARVEVTAGAERRSDAFGRHLSGVLTIARGDREAR
jgi:serine/threonine-protein kinase